MPEHYREPCPECGSPVPWRAGTPLVGVFAHPECLEVAGTMPDTSHRERWALEQIGVGIFRAPITRLPAA